MNWVTKVNNVYLGLVHHPVYNKRGKIISSAITNYDIHDIARASRTYGIRGYYIIHPLSEQINLAREIILYWQQGYGGEYNPDRAEALSILDIFTDIDSAIESIESEENCKPIVITTDARKYNNTRSYRQVRNFIETGERPILLLFGTAWGIQYETMQQFDYILEPIYGIAQYNHLSVRSAVAIILDRLLGEKWWLDSL